MVVSLGLQGVRGAHDVCVGRARTRTVTNGFNALNGVKSAKVNRPYRPPYGHLQPPVAFVQAAQIFKTRDVHQVRCDAKAEVEGDSGDGGLGKTLLLGLLFAGWYGANIRFNIFNKLVLNVYPYPVTCTCLQFAVGSVLALLGMLFKIVKPPPMSSKTILTVLPLAIVHTLGNLFTNVSLGKVAVSFTHTIKAMEPFFSVILSAIFLGDRPSLLVVLTLIPIVGGVAAASLSEATFNWGGFAAAMGSNITFQSRNVLSKKTMGSSDVKMNNITLFSLITIMSFVVLLPIALLTEGFTFSMEGMKALGIADPGDIMQKALAAGAFFHLYQQISYMILQRVSPVTHSIGNCIKRVIVIVASVIYLQNPMSTQNQIGTGIALFGVFLYSQAKRMSMKKNN